MVKIKFELSQQKHIDVVLGRDKTFPRSIAINMMPESNIPNATEILFRVLRDQKEPPRIRHIAAISLWRTKSKEASDYLLQAAETEKDPGVLSAIVKSLGRIGDERALPMILRLKEEAIGNLANQAAFAASLLSYRLGLKENDLPTPTAILKMPENRRLMTVGTPDDYERERFSIDLDKTPYGIELNKDQLIKIDHPAGSEILALNRDLPPSNLLEFLVERKTLLGIIATRNTEDGGYCGSYLIFTSPAKARGSVNVTITRTTGEMAWAGEAILETREKAVFKLRTVGRFGIAPMEAEGSIYSYGKLEITHAETALGVAEKKHPRLLRRE